MATRKSQFARVLDYFRTGDRDEVRSVVVTGLDIIKRRDAGQDVTAPFQRKRRARKAKPTEMATGVGA